MEGLLLYPRADERPIEHLANRIPCCLMCRGMRGYLHLGAWLADALERGGEPDLQDLKMRLEMLESLGYKQAKSSHHNVQQAIDFRDPGGMRMAKLEPLLHRTQSRCVWCRKKLSLQHADTSFEHLIPQSKGGGDSPDNLLAACRPCNSARGNMPPALWVQRCVEAGKQPLIRIVGQHLQKLENSRRKRESKWAKVYNADLKDVARELQGTVPFD